MQVIKAEKPNKAFTNILNSFMYYIVIFLSIIFCFFQSVNAQLSNRNKIKKDLVINAAFHYGKSLKHTSKFKPDIPENAAGVELNIGVNTSGRHHWHHRFHFPEIGAAFIYLDFGNNAVLGRGMALFPYIALPVVNKEKYKFQIRLGCGIGYIDKSYDVIDNPTNNVIGSAINNIAQLKFINNIKLSKKWRLLGAFAFTHFSNGNMQKPNLGINTISGNIGLQYTPNEKPVMQQPDSTFPYKKRVLASIKSGIAINEGPVPGAAKYPIYIVEAVAIKHISRFSRFRLGVEYEYRSDIYASKQLSIDNQNDISRIQVSRFAIIVGNELMFGNFGLQLNAAVYVNKFLEKPFFLYNKLGVCYYPPLQKSKQSLYVGMFLKSHFAIADYIEYGMGWIF